MEGRWYQARAGDAGGSVGGDYDESEYGPVSGRVMCMSHAMHACCCHAARTVMVRTSC